MTNSTDSRPDPAAIVPVARVQLFTLFQPIFALPDYRLIGHEMLVRGRSKDGLILGAEHMLHYAQEQDCAERFDELAHLMHLEQIDIRAARGIIFLNFVPGPLVETAWRLSRLSDALNLNGGLASRFVLEATQIDHLPPIELRESFRLWRDAGFRLAIHISSDHEPVAQLLEKRLFAYVKLDRQLICGLDQCPARQLWLRELIEYAHSWSIAVIAVGIEREEDLAACAKVGVNYVQGFLLGRPEEEPHR